ncbi:hypothetical protein [Saccharothrix xinjiangensis]|uniref:3'-5' exonuclease n=1 Tax=Saccharothrix xinjiangensis TaxID=204798 RepID=A0ABV9XW96_9PSEU
MTSPRLYQRPAWEPGQAVCLGVGATSPDAEAARLIAADVLRLDLSTGTVLDHRGYDTESAADRAVLVLNDIETGWADRLPLVVWEAPFALTVLDRELRRHLNLGLDIGRFGPVLDPHIIDHGVDTTRPGPRSLAGVCAHYGLALDVFHTSASDAHATGRLLIALLARHRAKLTHRDLADLWRIQNHWWRARARTFGRDPHWPFVPVPNHHGVPA